MKSFWLLPALLLAVPAAAQEWAVDLSAGASRSPVATDAGTHNLIAGLRYQAESPFWAYLYGGSPLTDGEPLWTAVGAGGGWAWERGSLSIGVNAEGHAAGYSSGLVSTPGGSATGELLPTFAWRTETLSARLRSGLLMHTRLEGDVASARSIHKSDLSLSLQPTDALAFVGEGRLLRTAGESFPYAGASVQVERGRATAWGYGGLWLVDSIPIHGVGYAPTRADYGVGVGIRILDGLSAHLSWRQQATDPVYEAPLRRDWSIQLSRTFGRAPVAPTSLAPIVAGGEVTLRIPVETTDDAPSVVGDFTGWEPIDMARAGEFWEVRLPISPGVYHYGFQSSEGEWFVPESIPHRTDDGMGGVSALLVVS